MADEISTACGKLKTSRSDLMGRDNVVATGVGYKHKGGNRTETPSIVCSVARKLPLNEVPMAARVPETIDGIPTDVVETGRIRALQSRRDRLRPAPGGSSIGHFEITAGTLGCLVKRGGETFILSNNHVIANSNDAQQGDSIIQPGAADGGANPRDQIATLEDFVTINFQNNDPPSDCSFATGMIAMLNAGCTAIGSRTRYRIVRPQSEHNLVDAAIARPLNPEDVSDEILDIGQLNGTASAELGMAIQKSGRTTGFTQGEIQQIDVTVNVSYGGGNIAQFEDQLLAGAISQGGDSGSAVLDNDRRLVGLLFAGSDTTTIMNRIEHVFSALNLSL